MWLAVIDKKQSSASKSINSAKKFEILIISMICVILLVVDDIHAYTIIHVYPIKNSILIIYKEYNTSIYIIPSYEYTY